MKRIKKENVNQEISVSAANEAFKNGSVIFYKNDSYTAILARIGDNKYGFVCLSNRGSGSVNTPTFVDTTSVGAIYAANKQDNREIFIVDRLNEIQ